MPKYWTKKDLDFSGLSPKVAVAVESTAGVMLMCTLNLNKDEGSEYTSAILRLVSIMKRIEEQVDNEAAIQ